MRVLAIESSCDESAMALFDTERGLCGEWVRSQIDLHGEYGGVVPDLASREHLSAFAPMLRYAEAEQPLEPVDAVAVTVGPGLAGCLAVGVAAAQALSLAWGVPVLGVNHLRGHAFSPFIGLHASDPAAFASRFQTQLPHLGLLVSGGNTVLFRLDREARLEILAQTVDDAAGEAIDKGAKLLGMPYPGGVQIERLAAQGQGGRFDFPVGVPGREDLRFSFSGLKTSLRYQVEAMGDAELETALPDLCADYQRAVIRQLVSKTRHALARDSAASLGLSGGVANNGPLREAFSEMAAEHSIPLFMAERRHTGDNAAMIAFAAVYDQVGVIHPQGRELRVQPAMTLT